MKKTKKRKKSKLGTEAQKLIAVLESCTKSIKAKASGPIDPHEAYEEQMEYRDRKRERIMRKVSKRR